MPHFKNSQNQIFWLDAHDDPKVWLAPDCVQITDDDADVLRPAPEPTPIAPISPRQIRMALTRAGLRPLVEAAVSSGDQDLKDWWEFSTSYERTNPQVLAMGAALGQTEEQLEELWKLGATL